MKKFVTVRCACIIPGGIQCRLAMYHEKDCEFEPYLPFSQYLECDKDGSVCTTEGAH